MRRARIGLLVIALAASVTGLVLWLRPRPPKRIVLVVVDTLRRDHVSAYGGKVATPNIDGFAAGGTVFHGVSASYHQTTMSMASLFTGRTPSIESTAPDQALPWVGRTWCGLSRFASGPDDACVPRTVPTLAEALRAAGYHTVGFASNPLLYRPAGYDRGFDEWMEVGADADAAMPGDPDTRYDLPAHAGPAVNHAVAAWLTHPRPDERVFLYVHYMDVHDAPLLKRPYADGVRQVDRHIGELRRLLDGAGFLADAVVILTADHGESLGERHPIAALPSHMGNPSFEPVLDIPLIVWPALPHQPDRLMRTDDTSRLIRTIARLPASPAPDLARDEVFLTELRYVTYRRGDWKSMRQRGGDKAYLFDLAHDPGETIDVAALHPDVVTAMRARMDDLGHALVAAPVGAHEPSPEDRARMRALGYVD